MIINIRVKANSKKQEIKKLSTTNYLINLKQPPENNKANLDLIKLLKKHLKEDIKIIKGHRSKNKVVKVKNANKI